MEHGWIMGSFDAMIAVEALTKEPGRSTQIFVNEYSWANVSLIKLKVSKTRRLETTESMRVRATESQSREKDQSSKFSKFSQNEFWVHGMPSRSRWLQKLSLLKSILACNLKLVKRRAYEGTRLGSNAHTVPEYLPWTHQKGTFQSVRASKRGLPLMYGRKASMWQKDWCLIGDHR